MPTALIDTNILVYAYDRGEYVKQQQAIRVLESLQRTGMEHENREMKSRPVRFSLKAT